MAKQVFKFESLTALDGGRMRVAFDQKMRALLEDCRDRPGLKQARKLTLTVSLVPVPDERGELDSCTVAFDFKVSNPKLASKAYDMKATRGGLIFNELSPEDIDQMTIDEVGPKAAEVTRVG